jgi:transcriptional regulator with XRE-family HTH domain
MADKGHAFRTFLQDEMNKRGFASARAFAEFLNVSQSTISSYLKDDPETSPSLDLLITLAEKTNVSLALLIAFAYPEIAPKVDIDPSVMLVARLIVDLPEGSRDLILAMARTMQGHSSSN